MRKALIRILVVLTLLFGTMYVGWRWAFSVYWEHWWIAVPLVLAETYALIDAFLFGATVWRMKERGPAPEADPGATVDVFITTYNEPVGLVTATAVAAKQIRFPHETWILDDGDRPEMAAMAESLGIGCITRHPDWADMPKHAKAGNLNNALFATEGEFLLILDADQIPRPEILDHTLGWFNDPGVALVQTPQFFTNVTDSDPLGSQAPLFYGPIQQGKDGWNAAFFCGSNAILRREALMQLGIVGFVQEVQMEVGVALKAADRILARALTEARQHSPAAVAAITTLRGAARTARAQLFDDVPVGEVTYRFQKAVEHASRSVVDYDLEVMRADLEELSRLPVHVGGHDGLLDVDDAALRRLSDREWSPLGAIESVRTLVRAIDVDRADEAQPMMPMATISVTEDMATCMRLHSLGWASVYHHENLANGLAPEDLRTMLTQRLRWAQGTLQVLLKENPFTKRGLSVGQRLMYFSTMWSYLSGFAAIAFLAAPVFYLCFGVLPVHAYGLEFLRMFVPYVVLNQLLFFVVGYGVKTWRGHQYSLALFPLWIRACTTAAANVFLDRPLGFAVTPKTRQEQGGFPFRLVWPQLTATVVLVLACVVGMVRLWTGAAESAIGTGVNIVWVAYDLLVISVIYRAALFRAPEPNEEHVA
ncbi:MAG: glycosyltransferase [Sporichthyaceae bacterium]|nr:glycosyltransferase [Sporichthyaceae bacterium]